MKKIPALLQKQKNTNGEMDGRQAHAGEINSLRGSQTIPLASDDGGPEKSRLVGTELAASIIVPTRGRPQLLNRCLASLATQQFAAAHFEIIVVDDGPSDDTRKIVTDWAARGHDKGLRISYIASHGPHGPAAARNKGWHAARGAILAFTDDDTIAHECWLRQGVQAFGDAVDAVTGCIVMPLAGTPSDYERDAKHLETAEFVTANCFVRREVMEELGGFDERFRFAWREDSDLHFRLLERRANVVRAPQAVMVHPVRPADWGVSLTQVKKVQFDALLYKKHPQLYRHKIRATPRWDFYITVGALLVTVGALASGASSVAVLAGLVWLVMTARFCARRLTGTSRSPAHIAEMAITSALIPPAAVFWRAVGAYRFRVLFV